MATPVWIVACKEQPTLLGSTLGAQCPTTQRTLIQTTLEFFQQTTATTAEPVPLDPGTVFAVFSASFSVALLFFLFARGVGTVLRLIRFG